MRYENGVGFGKGNPAKQDGGSAVIKGYLDNIGRFLAKILAIETFILIVTAVVFLLGGWRTRTLKIKTSIG